MELVHLVLEQFYFNELFHFFQVIRFSSVVAGSKHLFWLLGRGMCVCGMLVAQPCLTLCGPMACTQTRSSVHGLLQARILEWVAIPFSRGSSQPRDQTHISCVAGRCPTIWATTYIPLFWISFPFRSPESIEYSSLCCTMGSHQWSILCIVVYTLILY